MKAHNINKRGRTILGVIFFITAIVLVIAFIALPIIQGTYVWGPTRTHEVVINTLYVDRGSESSHYMVGTDKGTFEIDNGLLIGMWNADELYSKLSVGKRYRIVAEGNKFVGMFWQYYPYVTDVKQLE